GPVLAERLSATLDGAPLTLTCEKTRFELLDHVRCEYRFRAPWKLEHESRHTFTFREGNYDQDDVSAIRLSLTVGWQLTSEKSETPPEELIDRAPEKRSYKEYARLREASATFAVTPSEQPGAVKPGLSPEPEPARGGPSRKQRAHIAGAKDPPGSDVRV